MKNINARVTDNTGIALPGVIVTAAIDASSYNTTTNNECDFFLTVPDNETQLNFYTGFLAGGQPYKTFTIPTPLPASWNVRLNLEGPVISAGNAPATSAKKMNLWPVYAGIGLLAFLLIRKMRKKKKRK